MDLKERVREFYRTGKPLVRIEELSSFFDELINIVFPDETPEMKRHLSRDVLARFSLMPEFTSQLSTIKKTGSVPFFLNLLGNGLEQATFMERGDFCLFTVGLFPGFRERSMRAYGREYFTGYGRNCYYAALDMNGFAERREVVLKLAGNFRGYVHSLNAVSEATFRQV